jgi:hypothetical protein
VRGLSRKYAENVHIDIEAAVQQAISMLDQAKKNDEGWITPDGTLFVPAPRGYHRDRQVWVLACNYRTSAAFLHSAFDSEVVDIVRSILGPDVELYGNGQCLYKEPVGGHPKALHQDGAYHEHKYEGPVAVLNYTVDTDLNNGALYVIPGSHSLGLIEHGADSVGHLGLNERQWPWERAIPVCGRAGDAIFFGNNTIHGSKENYSTGPRPVFVSRYRRADDYVVVGGTDAGKPRQACRHGRQGESTWADGLRPPDVRAGPIVKIEYGSDRIVARTTSPCILRISSGITTHREDQ